MKTRKSNSIVLALLVLSLTILGLFPSWKNKDVDYAEILKKADFHRGGTEGVAWDLKVQNIEQGELKDDISLLVEASVTEEHFYSLITFLSPKKFEGQKLLLHNNNMWFMKIGLRGPVPISGRQRLSGQAASADVAAADYHKDYAIAAVEEHTFNGIPCWRMDLQAKHNLVSYPQIKYWISKKESLGLQAEFYGSSGKLIKAATFEYDNPVVYKSKKYDYISKITIFDRINQEDKTILNISAIRFVNFNNAKFQKDRLLD
jgi:hypothetical protein